MKKNILTMAALLIASAAVFTACSNDDDITGEQPANPAGKYTMTINATKGDGATTRALDLNESGAKNVLNVKWAATDQVAVYLSDWSGESLGTLTAAASETGSTSLTGDVTTDGLATGNALNLLFPRATWDYTGQMGLLLSDANSIEKKYDYALATPEITVDGDNITANATFESQQAIVKFTLKDKATGNTFNAHSLKIAAAGGKLVQSRGLKPTYTPEGWEPVSSGNKHYIYIETNSQISNANYTVVADSWQKSFKLDATYGTDGQLTVGGKYLYRFVYEGDTPGNITNITLYDSENPWSSPVIEFYGSTIAYSDNMYLNSSLETVQTGEGDPAMASTYGPLTVTPADDTSELTVALRNELGAADMYSFEATDAEGNTYIFSRQGVNFENGKYYEITMSMEKVAASKYVDLSTKTADYEAQDGDVLTGELPGQYHVTIAAGATVTLFNTTIKCGSENYYPAVACQGNATIILKGSNIATSSSSQSSAIQPYSGSGYTLTIQGNGSLTATGQVGIGGGPWDSGFNGNITIAGGNITAIGKMGAGIGTGENGTCGNILISGGTVNATSSGSAAGIGSGSYATCGNIEISGGTVNATGGSSAAGIGCGSINSNCGTITITNGVTSVTATKGNNAAYSIGKSNSGGGTCGTITIGGTEYPDGISESPYTYTPAPSYPLLSAATTADYGKVVCADGHLHDAKTAVPDGCTAVGILGKVTETGHGLILALQNANSQNWNTINGWTSTTDFAGTTLKVLPDNARGTNLTSYTTLGETTVSNWAVAQRGDYNAIFTNLGSTTGVEYGKTFDGNVNAYITEGVGGTAISGDYWSATEYGKSLAMRFDGTDFHIGVKSTGRNVRPVLGFGGEATMTGSNGGGTVNNYNLNEYEEE